MAEKPKALQNYSKIPGATAGYKKDVEIVSAPVGSSIRSRLERDAEEAGKKSASKPSAKAAAKSSAKPVVSTKAAPAQDDDDEDEDASGDGSDTDKS